MKIGYIRRNNLEMNPHLTERLHLEKLLALVNKYTGDKIYSKMLAYPVDYEEVLDNANWIKETKDLILVGEPFLLDDELKERVERWVV